MVSDITYWTWCSALDVTGFCAHNNDELHALCVATAVRLGTARHCVPTHHAMLSAPKRMWLITVLSRLSTRKAISFTVRNLLPTIPINLAKLNNLVLHLLAPFILLGYFNTTSGDQSLLAIVVEQCLMCVLALISSS
jgi:hypothetical protein